MNDISDINLQKMRLVYNALENGLVVKKNKENSKKSRKRSW